MASWLGTKLSQAYHRWNLRGRIGQANSNLQIDLGAGQTGNAIEVNSSPSGVGGDLLKVANNGDLTTTSDTLILGATAGRKIQILGNNFNKSTVGGAFRIDNSSNVNIDSINNVNVNLDTDNNATSSFNIFNSAGFNVFSVDETGVVNINPGGLTTGSLIVSGAINAGTNTISLGHAKGITTSPTTTAGTGAGTSPTISLTGTDLAGQISVTTGTLPTGAADVVTVTLNIAFAATPYVTFSAANSSAAALSGLTMVYVTTTSTTFKFTVGATGLTAATQYIWNYTVIG